MDSPKVIIVEGKTDKERILKILDEPVKVLCTFGTLSEQKIEDWIIPLEQEEVFILVDADEPGNRLRQQLKRELPNANHLYTRKVYREVANTPLSHLAEILLKAHFQIHSEFLMMGLE